MLEKEIGGLTLQVGLDESNHAPSKDSPYVRQGEIVVATFSYRPEDGIVKKHKNARDYQLLEGWLDDEERDFRFTMLNGEQFHHNCSSKNLIYCAPALINAFLNDNPCPLPKILKSYFDGALHLPKRAVRELLVEETGIAKIVVDNFIKKKKEGNKQKRPNCPPLVYMADVQADVLLHTLYRELANHPKFVPIR